LYFDDLDRTKWRSVEDDQIRIGDEGLDRALAFFSVDPWQEVLLPVGADDRQRIVQREPVAFPSGECPASLDHWRDSRKARSSTSVRTRRASQTARKRRPRPVHG
jgi:hypothetical protein